MRFRVLEKWSEGAAERRATFLSARRDVEVTLGRSMSVDVDLRYIARVIEIADAMARPPEGDGDFVDAAWEDASDPIRRDCSAEKNACADATQEPAVADEFSKETYDRFMRRYAEARHLARTRELRGGVLIPSFDERDDADKDIGGDVSFDAFFDANDESEGHCRSADEAISGGDEGCGTGGREDRRGAEQTKIELGLPELMVKVGIGRRRPAGPAESEYVLLSLGDLRVILHRSDGESKVNCGVSHFDVESQLVDVRGAVVNEPLLRFLDDSDGGAGGESPLSSHPCLSMMAESSEADDGVWACRVDVVLQPLEIIYRRQVLRRITDVIAKVPWSETAAPDKGENSQSTNVHLSVSSNSILLVAPCLPRETKPDPLFRRHGYIDRASGGSEFLGLGLELDGVAVDLSRKTSGDAGPGEFGAVARCGAAVLFARGAEPERGRRGGRGGRTPSLVPRRADLLALVGDGDGAPGASATLTSSSAARPSSFPIVPPPSFARARQEPDGSDGSDDEVDRLYDEELSGRHVLNYQQFRFCQ